MHELLVRSKSPGNAGFPFSAVPGPIRAAPHACGGDAWVLVCGTLGWAEGWRLARSELEKIVFSLNFLREPTIMEIMGFPVSAVPGPIRATPHARGGRAACVAGVLVWY